MKLKILLLLLMSLIGCSDKPLPLEDLNFDEKVSKFFGSPLLFSYDSCEQLAAELKKTSLDEMHTRFAIHLSRPPDEMLGIAMPAAVSEGAANKTG